uniref:Major facilitator superfamily (MFS) profile domain-containing protein n=1 Tax=Photinus pyralis TaxID=7054 RepID=A0A1Y1KHM0_PHOPY
MMRDTARGCKVYIEIPVLLLSFAVMFENTISTHLVLYKTCYVTLGFNATDCAMLGTGHESNETALLETMVQPYAAILLMGQSFIHAFIQPVFCFFLSSWSDKYGRKPILLSSFIGYIGSYMVMIVISAIPESSPWLILLSLIPICFTGGFPLVITTSVSYITDITEEKDRGLRLGSWEAAFTIGILLGNSCSSFALRAFGYLGIYVICIGCSILALFYIMFLLDESVVNVETEDKFKIFKLSLVKKTMNNTFDGRNVHDKLMIVSVMALMLLYTVARFSDHGILFLYLRQSFGWSLQRFTLFASFKSTVAVVGSIIGAFLLNKVLRVKETVVLIIAFLTTTCYYTLLGLATANWQIYMSGCFKCLVGAINPMARLLLSKLIERKDIGKVLGLIVALESIIGHIGNSLFTYLYNLTLSTYPQTFCFVTAGIYLFEVILTM